MSELKPCPFCGKKPNPNWTDESYIECTNRKCSVYGYGMSTGDWNTRPIEDALNKRIAELERDFDMLFRSSANKQPRKNTQTLTFEYGMESEE